MVFEHFILVIQAIHEIVQQGQNSIQLIFFKSFAF
jgi:hypothetical protein